MKILHWTIHDLDYLPENGSLYEIIDGELYMLKAPDWQHQFVCGKLHKFLDNWNDETQAGMTLVGPGIIFSDDNAVIPDIIWRGISYLMGNGSSQNFTPHLFLRT